MNTKLKNAGIAAVLFVAVILILIIQPRPRQAEVDLQPGLQVIRMLETKDPAEVEDEIKEQRRRHLQETYDEEIEKIRSGEINVWSRFDDCVICGDSRAVGFWFYDFLPEDYCYTEGGATIKTHLETIEDEIAWRDPENVFLLYGLNDVSIGFWDTPEEYVRDYEAILKDLHEKLPEAKFFISSILPARGAALDLEYTWYFIPDFSEAVKDMCSHLDYCYFVDVSEICEEYADLWEVDGIHVRREFYEHWAAEMIVAQYKTEIV